LSTSSNNSGETGYTGDKSDYIVEDNDKESNNRSDSTISKNCNCHISADPRIGHNHPFYFCKDHPKVQNIHSETIEYHLLYQVDHRGENTVENQSA